MVRKTWYLCSYETAFILLFINFVFYFNSSHLCWVLNNIYSLKKNFFFSFGLLNNVHKQPSFVLKNVVE